MFLIGFVLKFVAKIHYPCHSAKKNEKNVKRAESYRFFLCFSFPNSVINLTFVLPLCFHSIRSEGKDSKLKMLT